MTANASHIGSAPTSATQDVRAAIGAMNIDLDHVQESFKRLHDSTANVQVSGPTTHDIEQDVNILRSQVRDSHASMEQEIHRLDKFAREEVKKQAYASLQEDLLEFIKEAVRSQVRQQVDIQIQEQIPISLKQQSSVNQTQVQDARTSLNNSDARKKNSSLRIQNLDEELSVILRADGSKGSLFPANLRSLLSYDAENMQKLVQEYDLPVDPVREVNTNKFLGYIGIPFQLVL